MFTNSNQHTVMKHSYFSSYVRSFLLLVSLIFGVSRVSAQCSIIDNNGGKGCLNTPTCFTANAPAGCNPTKFEWDFGDTSTTTTTTNTACHTYVNVNTTGYTVKVTITCANGSKVNCTLSAPLKVFPLPVPDVSTTSPNPQCEAGNVFNFKDNSTPSSSGAKIVQRRILYGDGSQDISTGAPAAPLNTSHTYNTYVAGGPNGIPKSYTVTIEIIDENGCRATKVIPNYITVGGKIDISFTSAYTIKCDSTPVTFTNTSLDILSSWAARPGRMKSFTWDFGDGTTYTGYSVNDPKWTTFSHMYKNKMGPFNITLTVTDSNGCQGTYTLKRGADNIYAPADFKVTHTGVWGDSDSACYKDNNFTFKVPEPIHPTYIFKSSYNFNDPNSGPQNTYPNLPQDPILWVKDHQFSDCGIYWPKVTVTVYMPNGTTVICSKTDSVYVKVWGPHANIQSPAKGICVKNRYQCHIKDTVYFTNISTYCQGDTAAKKRNGQDSIISPNTVAAPTVLRLWDFDDLGKALPCTTYSDPITNPAKFAYRISDTMNTNKNCNFSMDSLPKHWYTPGEEKCYTVKLYLVDLKTGCGDTAQLSLALQPPKAQNSIDLEFQGQQCLSDGNDGRKVRIKWQRDEPGCANQFVWLNFDSACGINNFTPQTAFNPLIFPPPVSAYGCTYTGNTPINFSLAGHTFKKDYTKQYTSFCDPSGNITIGLVVQNGCDSAIMGLNDSVWVYWTGCTWERCPFTTQAQKAACRAAHPNTTAFPAYAKQDDSRIMNYYSPAQKATALAAIPGGTAVCYACRDTFWYHNSIQYKELQAGQDNNIGAKPKYCVWESDNFCPDATTGYQSSMLSATWNFYLDKPGKPNIFGRPSDTSFYITDTIYRNPTYKRLRWVIKQYVASGNYKSDTSAAQDITTSFTRRVTIDTTFCYKMINSVLTKVIQRIDTTTKDSTPCARFTFTAPGKWVVDLTITNIDTCPRSSPRVIIVGNKIDFGINDTIFCQGEAVKPTIDIRYWWRRLPPQPPYDPYDYWNDKTRNPNSGGLSNREVYWINWGDGPFIKFDTAIRTIREHIYNNTGTYTIKIAWKDSDNCYDTLSFPNLVHVVKPHANFYLPQKSIACDQIIKFQDSSWIESGAGIYNKYDKIVAWTWDFGDGSLKSNQQNPNYRYGKNGDYFVTLKIFTQEGCVDSIVKKIHIAGPDPVFALATGLNDTGCVAYAAAIEILNNSDTTFRILQVKWGDGKDTTLYTPARGVGFPSNIINHIYTLPGKFCISVIATDTVINELGNPIVCIRKFPCDTCPPICITVLDYALAEFTAPDTVCVDEQFSVTAKDTNTYSEYIWDFGDGSGDVTVNRPVFSTNHSYTTPGSYVITYKPKYFFCAKTDTHRVTVLSTTASFTVDSSDKPTFKFTNTSTGTNSKTKYSWDFGDGKTSNEQNPTHIYALADTGCHNVRLIVDRNCPDTVEKIVCNYYTFHLVIPNVFTPEADGNNDVFDIDIDGEIYYNLSIFNRWGQKVFHSDVDDVNWNGKVNNTGADCDEGVYYYVFKYKTKADPETEVTRKGDVTIIRK